MRWPGGPWGPPGSRAYQDLKRNRSEGAPGFPGTQEEGPWFWRRTWQKASRRTASAVGVVSLRHPSAPSSRLFVRGEVNLDSTKGPDISDAIAILSWLFLGGKELWCVDAADVNDDGAVDISDGVVLLSFLFLGGKDPKDPFPEAGTYPTPDSLSCEIMQ